MGQLTFIAMPLALAAALTAVACRTTSDDRSTPAMADQSGATSPEGDEPILVDCPPGDVVCPQDDEPTVCSATRYEGRVIAGSLAVRAWGANVCEGRVALAKEACGRGLSPAQMTGVQCVPDASGGNCPAASVACDDTEEPTLCTAGQYGDQKLGNQQTLKGWGPNPCLARAALARATCDRNLNPVALGDVQCGPDPQGGECPPPEAFCKDPVRDSVCEGKKLLGRSLTTPLVARGTSSCEANQLLLRQACEQGIKPSDIEDIVCRFGK